MWDICGLVARENLRGLEIVIRDYRSTGQKMQQRDESIQGHRSTIAGRSAGELVEAVSSDEPKIKLERDKLQFERDKLVLSCLMDEFKIRSQELFNFQNENSRWQGIYVTALIVALAWVINFTSSSDKLLDVAVFFARGYNAFFLLVLALVNATYTFAIAMKGYHVQQLTLYLYDDLGKTIDGILKSLPSTSAGGHASALDSRFNNWEKWRKTFFNPASREGKPEPMRIIYYIVIGSLPFLVTFSILISYLIYVWSWRNFFTFQNIFFYIVSFVTFISFSTAFLTSMMNRIQKASVKTDAKLRNNRLIRGSVFDRVLSALYRKSI